MRIKTAISILESTDKGIVLVVNYDSFLIGTVTDGDVRRAIDKSNYFFDMTAQDFMSKDFISISPDDLASECLRIMADKKIGCLAVMQLSLIHI